MRVLEHKLTVLTMTNSIKSIYLYGKFDQLIKTNILSTIRKMYDEVENITYFRAYYFSPSKKYEIFKLDQSTCNKAYMVGNK